MSQSPSPGKMGDSCLKAHLPLSLEAGAFIRRERGTEQRSREGVDKFSTCRRARSILITQVTVWRASSWFVILASPLKVSKPPGAGMPEGLSLFKLVPRILAQTCCSSTSCILVRVGTHRNKVRRLVGGLQFPTITVSRCCLSVHAP